MNVLLRKLLRVVVLFLVAALPSLFEPQNVQVSAEEPTLQVGETTSAAAFAPGLERPACADTTFMLVRAAGRYTLLYDTTWRQAAWVAYPLTRADLEGKRVTRSRWFWPDPDVVDRGWPTALNTDYVESGYDRGHLLPSADRNATREENNTTFYFSNISPQYTDVNGGIWRLLEERVRHWARRYDSLYVVTGPRLGELRTRIGANGVGVPDEYFKALLVRHGGAWHAVGFLIPNLPRVEGRFMDYAMSVDELEELTGYDFFYRLPDSVQRAAESGWDRSVWR